MRTIRQKIMTGALAVFLAAVSVPASNAEAAGASFDPAFYASRYPDVVAALGTDAQVMYNHYLTYGMNEKRLPFAGAEPGQRVDGIAAATAVQAAAGSGAVFTPVEIKKLANYKSLKKKMTDEQFQKAYDAALALVTPLAGKSRGEQLAGIQTALRKMFDDGMAYSTTADHYNDPYGYFVLGTASCAGCARATGLCLNILGIPYEHVNENKNTHQWCRVNVDGVWWICDAFGLYAGPEPAPYKHPYVE